MNGDPKRTLDSSIIEKNWLRLFQETGGNAKAIERGVTRTCPAGSLMVKNHNVAALRAEGEDWVSMVVQIQCIAEHAEHGLVEVFEEFPWIMGEDADVERGFVRITNTVYETVVAALRGFLGEKITSLQGMELSSYTPKADRYLNWPCSASALHLHPASETLAEALKGPAMQVAIDSITRTLEEPMIHWMSQSLKRKRDGELVGGCVINGAPAKLKGDIKESNLPDGPWERRQFILVRPEDGEVDPISASELKTHLGKMSAEANDLASVYRTREETDIQSRLGASVSVVALWRHMIPDGEPRSGATSFATLAPHLTLNVLRYSSCVPQISRLVKIMVGALFAGLLLVLAKNVAVALVFFVITVLVCLKWCKLVVNANVKYQDALLTPGVVVTLEP